MDLWFWGSLCAPGGSAIVCSAGRLPAGGFRFIRFGTNANREHAILGTRPEDLRAEADAAVRALGWDKPYFVDADHINLQTVEGFLAASDFFTLDAADYFGKPADEASRARFHDKFHGLIGVHEPAGLGHPLEFTAAHLELTTNKFLWAMQEAGRIYRRIARDKAPDSFAIEISVDETDAAQSPAELLVILAMIADEGIPAQQLLRNLPGVSTRGLITPETSPNSKRNLMKPWAS